MNLHDSPKKNTVLQVKYLLRLCKVGDRLADRYIWSYNSNSTYRGERTPGKAIIDKAISIGIVRL